MPPADGLVGRPALAGVVGDGGSGTARGTGVNGGGGFSKRHFTRVISWESPRPVKEEPSPSSSVVEQPSLQQEQQEEKEKEQEEQQPKQQQQQQQQQQEEEEEGEQQQHQQQQQEQEQQQPPPPPPQQQGTAPRQRAGRTGGWSTRICNEPGCSTVPSYGAPGTKRQFCLQHAKPGMINVASKKCGFPGEPCGKVATYGVPGGKRERCAVHAEKNMVDIFNRKCLVSGCHLRATFGDEGGKRERCAKHTENGMVNFNRRRCAARGCLEVASHGVHKGRKQMFCVAHADREMVSIGNKKCTHPGCTLAALYAAGGGAGPHEVCARHADAGGDESDKPDKTAGVTRKKRGPYRKRVYDNSSTFSTPPVELSQGGGKRGRSAGDAATTAAAAAAAAIPDAKRKRARVDDRRQGRAGNTEASQQPFDARKQCPRPLRLLLQSDDGAGWTVLDWNWSSALVAAQPMPYV
eukprot:g18691.t1